MEAKLLLVVISKDIFNLQKSICQNSQRLLSFTHSRVPEHYYTQHTWTV